MSVLAVRRVVMAICVLGIAGMIFGSVADNNGTAITFGLVTAVAVLGLILVTTVSPPSARKSGVVDEEAAAELETRIRRLVADGADEPTLRALVRDAVRFGRAAPENDAKDPRG